jgi:hypothetical protein
MTTQPRTIQADLTTRCSTRNGGIHNLPTTLDYTTADPYAITITFYQPGTHQPAAQPWVLARGLFTTALLTCTAGEGDAKLWKFTNTLLLRLSSPDGQLDCELPLHTLSTFLSTTYGMVPLGTEHELLDIDALVARLLGEVQS